MDKLKFGAGLTYEAFKLASNFHKAVKKGFDEPWETILTFIFGAGFVVGVLVSGVWLVDFFVEFLGLFNSKSDDKVRKFIFESDCTKINELSDENIVSMLRILLDGNTLDEDERAILKVFNCLNVDRLEAIIGMIGLQKFISAIDGSENDNPLVFLYEKGLIQIEKLTDDASRLFVKRADCVKINSLSLEDIRSLILNLFSGYTGDEDENAILKILGCLNCEKVRELVTMRRVRVGNFLDEFQGGQERRLIILFEECGIDVR